MQSMQPVSSCLHGKGDTQEWAGMCLIIEEIDLNLFPWSLTELMICSLCSKAKMAHTSSDGLRIGSMNKLFC